MSKTNDQIIAEAKAAMIQAAATLEKNGVSRTDIYDILRDGMPESPVLQQRKANRAKWISAMLRVLNGEKAKDACAALDMPYYPPKQLMHDGAKKACKTLDLHTSIILDRRPYEADNKQYWINIAKRALSALTEQQSKEIA